ncbi:hypothetical protein TNCV_3352341 [Trichonephila clavipes]|nr:hypothetical protein TNCV_3352341 [Trichonephila clavipes]
MEVELANPSITLPSVSFQSPTPCSPSIPRVCNSIAGGRRNQSPQFSGSSNSDHVGHPASPVFLKLRGAHPRRADNKMMGSKNKEQKIHHPPLPKIQRAIYSPNCLLIMPLDVKSMKISSSAVESPSEIW